jgi:hypothetical protein
MQAETTYTWKTRDERKQIAERLYGDGWTMQRIAKALNCSHPTIVRDLREFVHTSEPARPKGGRPKGSVTNSLFAASAMNKPAPVAVAEPVQQTKPAEQQEDDPPKATNKPAPRERINPTAMKLALIIAETFTCDRAEQRRLAPQIIADPERTRAILNAIDNEDHNLRRDLLDDESYEEFIAAIGDKPRHDCFLCKGIGIITWGEPMHRTSRRAETEELDTLRQFATFIMVNLRDGMLMITGDPKRMHRLGELKQRINPLVPTTAKI